VKAQDYAEKYAPRLAVQRDAGEVLGDMADEMFEEAREIARKRGQSDRNLPYSAVKEIADKSIAIAKRINKMNSHLDWGVKEDWFTGTQVIQKGLKHIGAQNQLARIKADGQFNAGHMDRFIPVMEALKETDGKR
jgi:hypothetical protein